MLTRLLCIPLAFSFIAFGCKSKSKTSTTAPGAETANPVTGTPSSSNTPNPEVKPGPDPTVTGGKMASGREFCLAFMTKSVPGENGVVAQAGNKYFAAMTPGGVKAAVPDERSRSNINPLDGFTSILLPNDSFKTNCDPAIVDPPYEYIALDDIPVYAENTFVTKLCTVLKGTEFPRDETAYSESYSPADPATAEGVITVRAATESMPLACRNKTVYMKRRLVVRSAVKFQ
jgi:hypothetical protein